MSATGGAAPSGEDGLAGLRVLAFSSQIAGPYCSKLLLDGGADVVKVEGPGGDSLRRWSATGADLAGRDSALFSFLNAGKQSVVGTVSDASGTRRGRRPGDRGPRAGDRHG